MLFIFPSDLKSSCDGEDRCKGSDVELICKSGYPCSINCVGKAACQDADLDANGAISLIVTCQGTDACKGGSGKIDCSTSDCTISCSGLVCVRFLYNTQYNIIPYTEIKIILNSSFICLHHQRIISL